MAEIRANREYKFKEFCISEEIPKCPPIKAKRWTFQDSNPDGFYDRLAQRKWDEAVNCSGDTNINQQYVKPYKKPESHLRAEFFNAYKKYYRRVDIKRLEVESTLNVDAKLKGADESVAGECSLYKEKECMEINIVMDTEKDDALVSCKVRHAVLDMSPGEDEPLRKESIIHKSMTLGCPQKQGATINDQDILFDEIIMNESGDCPPSNLSANLSVRQEQKHDSLEDHPNLTVTLKQEQHLMNRTLVPLVREPQNCKKIDSKSGKILPQMSDNVSLSNCEQLAPGSCNGIVKETNFLEDDPLIQRKGGGNFLEDDLLIQRKSGGNSKATGAIPKIEKNKYTKRVERTFRNSKLKQNNKNPFNHMPFKLVNDDERFSKYEVFQNKQNNVKHKVYINCKGASGTSEQDGYDFNPLHLDNSSSNPSNDDYDISKKEAKSFNFDYNRNVDQFGPKSNPDVMLAGGEQVRKDHINKPYSNDFEEGTPGAIKAQVKNPISKNPVSILRTESVQESSRNQSISDNKSRKILTLQGVNSESGVRFRGIRGGPFNELNKSVLKSLVVSVTQDEVVHGRNVIKREFDGFPKKEEPILTQGNNKKEVLETGDDALACSRASSQSNDSDPASPNCGKLEVPERFQNITKTISNDLCREESPFTSVRSENIEQPFVVWTNKNSTDINESLQIKKLTISDNESETGYDYNNHSNPRPFPGSYSLRETSDDDKNQKNKQQHRNHSQNSEKLLCKKHLKEDFKSSNGTERKENERDRTQEQHPEKLYSNMNSVQGKNFAVPNYSTYHKSSRVFDDDCVKEDPKKKTHQEEVAVSFDENGCWSDERKGDISQMNFSDESFGKRGLREISRQNSSIVREKQATERVPRRYEKDAAMNETRRTRKIQEEDAGKTNFSRKVPIEQSNINIFQSNISNKNITKSSNSDYLQIGPTYSVHYRPVHEKQMRRDPQKKYVESCGAEEMDNRRPSNSFQFNNENATDIICQKWNERSAGMACNNLPPLYCDNYLNTCRHEIICNSHLQPNSDFNGCCCPNAGNSNRCDCDDFNRGSYHRLLKNINACSCHATDPNLHCYSPIDLNCSHSKHRRRLSCPRLEGNRSCCQLCNGQQMKLIFNECSSQFHKPNNSHCCCTWCLNEMRINAASTRIENCYSACSGDEQMKYYPNRFDHERQWISTGHQPMRSSNKCTTNANKERSREYSGRCVFASDEVNEPFMKDYGNHCPVNSLNNDNHMYIQNSIVDDHIMNDPYYCNKEVKNVFQPASTGKESVRNYPLKGIKTEQKYYSDPVDSESISFNFLDRVDHSQNGNESKVDAIQLKPEQNVYVNQERNRFSNEDNEFCLKPPLDSYDRETKSNAQTHKVSDPPGNEPLFLCEEQWDSDGVSPIRRVIRKRKEKVGSSVPREEPIYLREEQWGSGDEGTEENVVFSRNIPSTSRDYPSFPWNIQRLANSHVARETKNVSGGGEYRKCSSPHAVSDPGFQCEEQWGSGEEKSEDHKAQSTLPKNITRRRKGKRRWYNPRRWDMVTDLPKNGFQNGSEEDDYQDDNMKGSVSFQNREYWSNNEQ